MTDVTASQVSAQSVHFANLRTPLVVLGRGMGHLLKACGRGLVDASSACALAHELAYVKPVHSAVERQRLAVDADLDGRDPSW